MFSIIIPVYNKAATIFATLNSVKQQTYGLFEVILVNDASTDNSVQQIEPFLKDSRFRLVHQANQGVSAARNNGIRLAAYDYVAFLDADDLWHPQYLEQVVHAIQLFPQAAIWGADYKWVFPDEAITFEPLEHSVQPMLIEDYFKHALQHLVFWTSATTVKKAALEQVGFFNESLKVGEDLDLWFRILLSFEGVRIPLCLALYMRSDRGQIGPGKLVPLSSNFIGRALNLYEKELSQSQYKEFKAFLYKYILSDLVFYYFDAKHKSDAITLLNSIALGHKLKRPRFILYFLPYKLANNLYQKLRRTKG